MSIIIKTLKGKTAAKVYTEKNPTDNYKNCDCIFVDHDKKTFWFTTKAHVQHTQQLTH